MFKINLQWDESLDVDCARVGRCIEIARNCTNSDRQNRPTIHEVISDLDELDSVIPPDLTNRTGSSLNQVRMINSRQRCSLSMKLLYRGAVVPLAHVLCLMACVSPKQKFF